MIAEIAGCRIEGTTIRFIADFRRGKSTDISSGHTGSSQASSGRLRAGSLTPAARQTDLNPPGGYLRVLLLADEVDFGGADVAVTGEFAHLMHRSSVTDCVVYGGLPQAMNPDATAAQPVGVDARRLTILLDESPGGLAIQVPSDETGRVGRHRPK